VNGNLNLLHLVADQEAQFVAYLLEDVLLSEDLAQGLQLEDHQDHSAVPVHQSDVVLQEELHQEGSVDLLQDVLLVDRQCAPLADLDPLPSEAVHHLLVESPEAILSQLDVIEVNLHKRLASAHDLSIDTIQNIHVFGFWRVLLLFSLIIWIYEDHEDNIKNVTNLEMRCWPFERFQ